jgi:hypothetical protein
MESSLLAGTHLTQTGPKSSQYLHDVANGKISISEDINAQAKSTIAAVAAFRKPSIGGLEDVNFMHPRNEQIREAILTLRDALKEQPTSKEELGAHAESKEIPRKVLEKYVKRLNSYIEVATASKQFSQ